MKHPLFLLFATVIMFSSNPAMAGPWSNTGSLPFPGARSAVLLQSGEVLVIGSGTNSSQCQIYDPVSGTFRPTASILGFDGAQTATLLNNGKVLITGGFPDNQLYDPTTESWTATGDLQIPSSPMNATLLENGKVLVAGGTDFESGDNAPLAKAELYDPATGTWSLTGSLNSPSCPDGSVRLQDGRVLIHGGDNFGGSTCEIYDPATETWSPTGNFFALQQLIQLILLPDGKVFALPDSLGFFQAEIFDPESGTWSRTSPPLQNADGPRAVLLQDGRILVTGDLFSGVPEAQIYDPISDSWSNGGKPSAARGYHAAVRLNDGKVLIAGGSLNLNQFVSSAELFDPSVEIPNIRVEDASGFPLSNTGPPVFFPPTAAGSVISRTLTIRNISSSESVNNLATVIVDGFPGTNGAFTASPLSSTSLDSSGSTTFELRFSPSSTGTKTATLFVTFDEGGAAYPVRLQGSGLAALTPFQQAVAAAELIGNNAFADSIPFKDGVANLLKFAFGLNLAGPDTRRMTPGGTVGLPTAYLHENGGTVFRVEYLRRKNSGLTYTPKKSTTLANGSFTPLAGIPIVSDVGDGSLWERVTIDEPYNPATTPKLFTTVEVVGE